MMDVRRNGRFTWDMLLRGSGGRNYIQLPKKAGVSRVHHISLIARWAIENFGQQFRYSTLKNTIGLIHSPSIRPCAIRFSASERMRLADRQGRRTRLI